MRKRALMVLLLLGWVRWAMAWSVIGYTPWSEDVSPVGLPIGTLYSTPQAACANAPIPGTWAPGFTRCWDKAGYATGYFARSIGNDDPSVSWTTEKIGAFDAQGTWHQEPAPAMSCAVGHPVQPATGLKVLTETDVALPDSSVHFQRTYRSTLFGSPAQGPGGWTSEWQRKLFFQDSDNASMPRVVARRQDGEAVFFQPNGTTQKWQAGNGKGSLQASYDTSGAIASWQYTASDTDAVETYDAAGKLLSVRERTGRVTTLNYDTNAQLTKITAPSGRSLTFAYDTQGRISNITAPDGAITQYAYNANGMLTTVTWPDNTTRQYVYEDTRFPRP